MHKDSLHFNNQKNQVIPFFLLSVVFTYFKELKTFSPCFFRVIETFLKVLENLKQYTIPCFPKPPLVLLHVQFDLCIVLSRYYGFR